MAVFERLLDPESPFRQSMFFLARRFVAGDVASEALDAVRELNGAGMSATLDFLGESVTSCEQADEAVAAYLDLITRIRAADVRANVSVKLSAIGLQLDEAGATERLRAIVAAAGTLSDTFVRVDMEGSATVDATLRIVGQVFAEGATIGPVLQAYLKRTPGDVERAIESGTRVRLCKGAYREPASIAYAEMPVIRREYLRLAEALLDRGCYPAIATHDERIIRAVRRLVTARGISPDRFEFQLLYGVRPDLQRRLVADGYRVRIYVPYGTHWAQYLYRRVTERKENAFFALRSVFST